MAQRNLARIIFADLAGPDNDELTRGLGLGSWRSRHMRGFADYRLRQYCSGQCFGGKMLVAVICIRGGSELVVDVGGGRRACARKGGPITVIGPG
ncbi:hypothetical protein E2562_015319 [Oryza meyeriana var. granulata]|uniref:Uncharacterized protein n=1 Tax=Oryza meyeriana var. granulata TaxID=110450 RepID=A0A6G1DJK5_9ORYZ|nr:hypothetical protein E2562_015319 [Oryza meyeriana var. granulata]